jgi:chromosome segregation ATPase
LFKPNFINKLSILQTGFNESKKEIEKLNEQHQIDRQKLNDQIQRCEKHMKICDKDLEECEAEKDDLQKKLSSIVEDLRQLRQQKQELETLNTKLSATRNTMQQQISGLNAENARLKASNPEYEQRIQTLTGRIQKAEADLQAKTEDFGKRLQEAISAAKLCETSKRELENKVEKLKEINVLVMASDRDKRDQLEKANSRLTEFSGSIGRLNARIGELENINQIQSSDLIDLASRNNQLANEMKQLEGTEAKVKSMGSKIKAIKKALSDAKEMAKYIARIPG